mgnify:CR=1 FL=1
MKSFNIGIVTTGSEVYYHRIKDKFGPILRGKMEGYQCTVAGQTFVPDNKEMIEQAIKEWLDKGADMVFCTGGMSVDPDDLTPSAIRDTGCEIITYGTPVLPGAMFLLSYYTDGRPVLGLPGCVMYAKNTIFDLLLPRIMTDDEILASEITVLGEGGLCLNCDVCTFPNCGFGK